jgi:hypothetical protein
VFCAVWEDVFGVGMVMSSCGLFALVFRAFLAGLVVLVNEDGIFGSFEQSPFVFTELTV